MKKLIYILIACLLAGVLPAYLAGAVSEAPPSGELSISGETDSRYRTMREALDDLGLSDALCASWIPERFTLTEVGYYDCASYTKVRACCFYEDKALFLTATAFHPDNSSLTIEKDETPVVVENHHGVDFYIAKNITRLTVWGEDDHCFYQIYGDVTYDEMSLILENME